MSESSPPPASIWRTHFHSFDIDKYLNHVVPRPRLYLFPRPVSHFLGYRAPGSKPQQPLAQPFVWLSACLGGFIGIAIISAVYHALPLLDGHQAPIVIASFGAAAILEYNTIESPLSQPRNLIVGHFLSALIGVSITKGFLHLPTGKFDELRWLAGALSVGLASLVMSITKTIHPPAGATALLASTSPDITVLGWWLLPLVLLASSLMAASALIVNNITRRWPVYWWTPVDLSKKADKEGDIKHVKDVEKGTTKDDDVNSVSVDSEADSLEKIKSSHVEHVSGRRDSTSTAESRDSSIERGTHTGRELEIVIRDDMIVLPDWMEPNDWEKEVLEIFKQRIQRRKNAGSRSA